MTIGTFIVKNAFRNKRRALLSVLSVAVSLFLFVTLLVVLRELTLPPEDVGMASRIIVRNKISLASLLPARQRPAIERIAGVEAVSPFSWFGGKFRGEENMTFAQFAMDPKMLRVIFPEGKLAQGTYEAFEKERTACVVGKLTAEKYGLKIGDKMQFESMIFPCSIELKIVGIYAGTIDDRNVLFNHDYLDEVSGSDGWVGTWWVKAKSLEDVGPVTEAINKEFENSSAAVRAETERAFQLSFISMLGNIKVFIGSICTVVVFTLVLVCASTMSMAIRERFRELAILKALGFRRRELFAFILIESFGLALLGAFLGVGLAWVLFTHPRISSYVFGLVAAGLLGFAVFELVKRRGILSAILSVLFACAFAGVANFTYTHGTIAAMTNNFLLVLEVTPRIIGRAALVAAGLGIVASIIPSISVARMSVVNGLKTLD